MFQLVIDEKKLGYMTYLVFFDLQPHHNETIDNLLSQFEDFIRNLGNITHINRLTTGDWDIDIEIKVKNVGEFISILEKIRSEFGSNIKQFEKLRLKKEFKFTFLIPVVMQEFYNIVYNKK